MLSEVFNNTIISCLVISGFILIASTNLMWSSGRSFIVSLPEVIVSFIVSVNVFIVSLFPFIGSSYQFTGSFTGSFLLFTGSF